MPPFGGFVSEWFTFEALLQSFRLPTHDRQLLWPLAAATLALTAGIGLLAFAKLYGGIFLGAPRARALGAGLGDAGAGRRGARRAGRRSLLGLGAVAPWEIRWLGAGLRPLLGFDPAARRSRSRSCSGRCSGASRCSRPTWLRRASRLRGRSRAPRARRASRRRRCAVRRSGSPAAAPTSRPSSTARGLREPDAGRPARARSATAAASIAADRAARRRSCSTTRVVLAFERYLYRPLTALALRDRRRAAASSRAGSRPTCSTCSSLLIARPRPRPDPALMFQRILIAWDGSASRCAPSTSRSTSPAATTPSSSPSRSPTHPPTPRPKPTAPSPSTPPAATSKRPSASVRDRAERAGVAVDARDHRRRQRRRRAPRLRPRARLRPDRRRPPPHPPRRSAALHGAATSSERAAFATEPFRLRSVSDEWAPTACGSATRRVTR